MSNLGNKITFNVRQQIEVLMRNKDGTLSYLAVLRIVGVSENNPGKTKVVIREILSFLKTHVLLSVQQEQS